MLAMEAEALTVTSPPCSTTWTEGERPNGPSDSNARSAACWPVAALPPPALAAWAPRLAAAVTIVRA